MCQPNHSIIQFEDDDSQGPGTSGRLGIALGKAGKWLKKIGRMLHLSKMGDGHSGALGHLKQKEYFLLPTPTSYEAHWWNRQFTMDGGYHGNLDKQEALDNARAYADQVSIGSLHSLRQFLNASIRGTDYPQLYREAFRNILNPKGRKQYENKLKLLTNLEDLFKNIKNPSGSGLVEGAGKGIESFVRLCLGFTRQRHWLVPEWADDTGLWKPESIVVPANSTALFPTS